MRFDLPSPDPETQPFWDACRQGRFLVRHCNACGRDYFYPRPFCPHCSSRDIEWFTASGRGTLHTYVISHRPAPGFQDYVPYVAAIVELDEGPRVMTNIEGTPFDQLRIGATVEVDWKPISDDVTIPVFRQVASGS